QFTQEPPSASQITSAVPSPPSAIGTMWIFASGKIWRRPVAIFSATSRPPSEPLNLSGAIRMRTRQVHCRNLFCHVERSRLPRRSFMATYALLQLALQNFAGQLRVGFPLGKLHHLSLEKIKRCSVARLKISSRLRVGRNHLIAECLDCARVAQLLDPFFLDDLGRSFAAREHFREHFLALFAADFAAVD